MKLLFIIIFLVNTWQQVSHKPKINQLKLNYMLFHQAYHFTKPSEGLWSNKTNDKGKETFMGISRRWHPNLDIWPIIDAAKGLKTFPQCLLTNNQLLNRVMLFYKFEFFDKLLCERIKDSRIQLQVYDFAITSWDDSMKLIQKLVGVRADGVMTIATIEAINTYPDKDELLKEFEEGRKQHYHKIVILDPTQGENLNGWLKRVDKCTHYASNSVFWPV